MECGWSPLTTKRAAPSKQDIERIRLDPTNFIAAQDRREVAGLLSELPDGSTVPRIPSYTRWLWEDDFCGWINFRWQPDTAALPAHLLGHVGFAVVDWQQGKGYARQALNEVVGEAGQLGLSYIELTADADNFASRQVLVRCGGVFIEDFRLPEHYGGKAAVRYRIRTQAASPA